MGKLIKKPLSVLVGKTIGEVSEEIKEFIKSKHPINNPLIVTFSCATVITSDSKVLLGSIKIRDTDKKLEEGDTTIFIGFGDWREIAKRYIKRRQQAWED